ncbi:hypothetical protein ACN20G_26535 (plasmid) [Streptomyces sp. BI20]|uniref:hypothetical protein n=1 Tax=Streptomyces sp. BI20 TaxID=3403460 RepID=UPI003C744E0E
MNAHPTPEQRALADQVDAANAELLRRQELLEQRWDGRSRNLVGDPVALAPKWARAAVAEAFDALDAGMGFCPHLTADHGPAPVHLHVEDTPHRYLCVRCEDATSGRGLRPCLVCGRRAPRGDMRVWRFWGVICADPRGVKVQVSVGRCPDCAAQDPETPAGLPATFRT